jgi:antitoxin ParD1/3/4
MSKLNVQFPPHLQAAIDRRVASGEYSGPADYLRELVRRDEQRRKRRSMEQLLLRRLDRGNAVEMDASDFAAMRRKLLRRVGRGKRA